MSYRENSYSETDTIKVKKNKKFKPTFDFLILNFIAINMMAVCSIPLSAMEKHTLTWLFLTPSILMYIGILIYFIVSFFRNWGKEFKNSFVSEDE